MTRTDVHSSILHSVGYDRVSQTLEIKFHESGIYQYYDVAEDTYAALLDAPSLGEYFNTYIKESGYRFKKMA